MPMGASPRGLGRGSTAARLLRLWVRIPPVVRMSVCFECCVLSGRGFCEGLITRPEKSYRLLCVVCDLGTSRMSRPCMTRGGSQRHTKQNGGKSQNLQFSDFVLLSFISEIPQVREYLSREHMCFPYLVNILFEIFSFCRAGYAASHIPHRHTSHCNALCSCPIVTTQTFQYNPKISHSEFLFQRPTYCSGMQIEAICL